MHPSTRYLRDMSFRDHRSDRRLHEVWVNRCISPLLETGLSVGGATEGLLELER